MKKKNQQTNPNAGYILTPQNNICFMI